MPQSKVFRGYWHGMTRDIKRVSSLAFSVGGKMLAMTSAHGSDGLRLSARRKTRALE